MFLRRDDFQDHKQWLAGLQQEEVAAERHLRLVGEKVATQPQTDPPPSEGSRRGVWLDPFPPPGTVAYVIVLSNGDRFRWEAPAKCVTEQTEPRLWSWLDRKDPVVQLRAV